MKFPIASPSQSKSVKLNSDFAEVSPNEVEIAADMSTEDIDLLDNLITFVGDVTVDQSVSLSSQEVISLDGPNLTL